MDPEKEEEDGAVVITDDNTKTKKTKLDEEDGEEEEEEEGEEGEEMEVSSNLITYLVPASTVYIFF